MAQALRHLRQWRLVQLPGPRRAPARGQLLRLRPHLLLRHALLRQRQRLRLDPARPREALLLRLGQQLQHQAPLPLLLLLLLLQLPPTITMTCWACEMLLTAELLRAVGLVVHQRQRQLRWPPTCSPAQAPARRTLPQLQAATVAALVAAGPPCRWVWLAQTISLAWAAPAPRARRLPQ